MTSDAALLRHQFAHGYCHWLAAALRQQYGFPIGVLTSRSYRWRQEGVYHAWVWLPDGACLDICGIRSYRDMYAYYDQRVHEKPMQLIRRVKIRRLEAWTGDGLYNDSPDGAVATATALTAFRLLHPKLFAELKPAALTA